MISNQSRAQTITELSERRQGHSARKFRQCGGERAVRETPLAATGARHILSSIRGSHLQPRHVFVTIHVRANVHGSFSLTFYYMSRQYWRLKLFNILLPLTGAQCRHEIWMKLSSLKHPKHISHMLICCDFQILYCNDYIPTSHLRNILGRIAKLK